MPHNAASDLDTHCLPVSLLYDAMHQWVKIPWISSKQCSIAFTVQYRKPSRAISFVQKFCFVGALLFVVF